MTGQETSLETVLKAKQCQFSEEKEKKNWIQWVLLVHLYSFKL